MNKKRTIIGIAAVMALTSSAVPCASHAEEAFSGYVLMNIPYSDFYNAGNAEICDVDAVSSATNKTGNYGKAGGAYHSGTTAGVDEAGEITAVGKENGSKVQGVTWAVKADSLDAVKALGGTEITADSTVATATMGKGATTSNTLLGYEALTEAPAYSYYVLESAPENYLELKGTSFTSGTSNAMSCGAVEVPVSYGTNWGDVDIDVSGAEAASDKIINAIVLTAEDGTAKGLYHLDQIWSYSALAWKVGVTPDLDGKKITNIRYYCTVKDNDLTDTEVPAYANYVYDYDLDIDVALVYTGSVTAEFKGNNSLVLNGLPEDAENVKVKVYHTTGGRTPVYTYITPMVVDPADDDIDPIFVSLENGAVSIEKGSVTNKAGTTAFYGELINDTTYTVEFSCDNYIIKKITVDYEETEDNTTGGTEGGSANTTTATNNRSSETTTAAKNSSTGTTDNKNKTNGTSSPKTGDTGAALPIAALALAGVSALVLKRKKK